MENQRMGKYPQYITGLFAIRQIEEKVGCLDNIKESSIFQSLLYKLCENNMENDALINSYKIENPNSVLNPHSLSVSKRELKKAKKNMITAFTWGYSNWRDNKFDPKIIDDIYIRTLAGLISPELHNNSVAMYRTASARTLYTRLAPTQPDKIRDEINQFTFNLQEILKHYTFTARIEASNYAHLHLARIHPFDDGNGRTARMLQTIILKSKQMPPPIIYPGEKQNYIDLMEEASLGWMIRKEPSKGETPSTVSEEKLYNYLAGKVSSSLDRMLQHCAAEGLLSATDFISSKLKY